MSDTQSTDHLWGTWKTRLLIAARKDGMVQINADDYREWFDDNYSPEDAWTESQEDW